MRAILGGALDGGAAQWSAAALLLLVLAGLAVVGTWLVVVDLREHRLPGDIVRPAWAASAAGLIGTGLLAGQPARIIAMAIGAAALWGLYWLLRRSSSGALGAGDVRLAGLLGTVLGFDSLWLLLWATVLAFVLGGLAAVVVLVCERGDLQTRVPFGPAMIGGAAAALVMV